MAAGFKTATVASGDVPATQTNFPSYVDLSRLGITTQAEADSVRVYADSGKTTEWAREIVSVDEMWVKVPSLTNTVEIYVDWDGSSADYAVTDTYGRNAVWTDYEAVYHLASLTLDSTGNSYTLTNVGTATNTAVEIGDGVDLGTTNSTKCLNMGSFPWGSFSTSKSVSFYIRMNTELPASPGWAQMISAEKRDGSARQFYHFLYEYNGGTRRVRFGRYSNTGVWCDYNITMGTSNTHRFMWKWDSADSYSRLYYNGANVVNTLDSGSALSGGATFNNTAIGRYTDSGNPALGYISADFDEVRFANVAFSADWETTEYNNQSDEAGFWGTWSDVGGGATYVPKSNWFM